MRIGIRASLKAPVMILNMRSPGSEVKWNWPLGSAYITRNHYFVICRILSVIFSVCKSVCLLSLHGVIESTEDSCIIMKDQTREHIRLSVAKIKAINPQQAQK